MRKRAWCVLVTLVMAFSMLSAPFAWADDTQLPNSKAQISNEGIDVSSDELAAVKDGVSFAIGDFERANSGSNRKVADEYHGYCYLIGSKKSDVMYVASEKAVVVYVNADVAQSVGLDVADGDALDQLQALLVALDTVNAHGNAAIKDDVTWHVTTDEAYELDGIRYSFDQELGDGNRYNCLIGADGSDITNVHNDHYLKPTHCCFGSLVHEDNAVIAAEPTWFESLGAFLTKLDWSPLQVTLRTTLTAIVFIFVLGLAAAYLCLHVSPRARDIFDTIFTIPMVLPPTVCGFLLLLALGNNTALGRWFIDIGFPLIFSWPATVIAAVIVAFPLMYRNARGAFESLDPNMLDAARTLGWSETRIFFKIMLPLSWSSIAAGTVLAFARALGEFGATLFLAGNYLGVTRTIPIAIYFEWMNGNIEVALFWTVVILIFSFIVILFINLWSQHTTRYRKGAVEE